MALVGTTFDGAKIGLLFAHKSSSDEFDYGESKPTIHFFEPLGMNASNKGSVPTDLMLVERGGLNLDNAYRYRALTPATDVGNQSLGGYCPTYFDGRDHYFTGHEPGEDDDDEQFALFRIADARGAGV